MKIVVFGCRGKKEKISVQVEDHYLWRKVKKRAWRALAGKTGLPITKLKERFCPIRPRCF